MINIVRKDDLISKPWAGGVTKQLSIYPPNAKYGTDSFLWRLSTATIEGCEPSAFTALPGIRRQLMILEGSLKLIIDKDQHLLESTQQIFFLGNQEVVGQGSGHVVDFNLMLAEPFDGVLQYEVVDLQSTLAGLGDFMGVYLVQGQFLHENDTLKAGDFILCEQETLLTLVGTGIIVVAHIWE